MSVVIVTPNGLGIRAATGPIVVFAEHAFPEPGWAEALLEAHRGPWTVVGPAILNANPETRTACADYLLTHGRFGPPATPHEADEVPAHNSSFKCDVLLELGDRLEDAMEAETVLWWRLRAAGHRLYFEPAARTSHLSVARLRDWPATRFYQSRLFGATRCLDWPRWRRLVYAGGAPLIPVLRLWRLLRALPQPWRGADGVARALPLIALGLLVEAAGEALGYLRGAGEARQLAARHELFRHRYTIAAQHGH